MKEMLKVARHSEPEGRRILRHLKILRPAGLRMTIIAVSMFLAGSGLCLAADSTKSSAVTGNAGIIIDNSAKSLVIPSTSSLIPAKAMIHIDDSALARLKAENLALRNNNAALIQQFNDIFNDRQAILKRLQRILNKNADLIDHLSQMRQKNQNKHKPLNEGILRKKLQEDAMELMATKNKDEGLKQEVANMHYNLGTVLQAQNKYDEAIKEFKMDLMFNPDDADAHYNLALIYDKGKNDRQEAINHYNGYLKITPEAPDALKVKERLTELEVQQKIWENPGANNIGEKQILGRI
jgi:tetratricopeptide (TPR) repeat protein